MGCGIAYDFYLKSKVLSPLPYAIAFAALPATPYLGKGESVPMWMVAVGGLFGIVAHFANVLKDHEPDQEVGIRGLPQKLSVRVNVVVCLILLAVITSVASYQRPTLALYLIVTCVVGVAVIALRPTTLAFPIIMALALSSVLALVY